jgi:protein ImuB
MNAEAVFARLRTALDPDNAGDVVVHPVQGDSHRPENAAHWQSADAVELAKPEQQSKDKTAQANKGKANESVVALSSAPSESSASSPVNAVAVPVLRLLDTPEPVDVEECAGLPDALWWRGRRLTLEHADGPERLSGDWWREDSYARDYWRCAADGEGDLLLYHETNQWFLQGWYD